MVSVLSVWYKVKSTHLKSLWTSTVIMMTMFPAKPVDMPHTNQMKNVVKRGKYSIHWESESQSSKIYMHCLQLHLHTAANTDKIEIKCHVWSDMYESSLQKTCLVNEDKEKLHILLGQLSYICQPFLFCLLTRSAHFFTKPVNKEMWRPGQKHSNWTQDLRAVV